jgi:uncharacterized membrane protein
VLLAIGLWVALSRISSLERKLERFENALNILKRDALKERTQASMPPPAAEVATHQRASAPKEATPGDLAAVREVQVVRPSVPPAPAPVPAPVSIAREPPRSPPPGPPTSPSIDEVVVGFVRDYFTGGNLVVRVGIIVLFFGVGFLLKYVAEHAHLSIKVRLAGVALGAVALFIVGWRLRERRRGFSLALQGGAVGILYLTLFAALKFYQLLPVGVTFGLMAGLGVALCLLAIRQDSLALSMLGAIGGFLAPLLTSTDAGNHVQLFSYYALLNLFIVVQAWFKAWRPLNLLAFVFTFGVGIAWGVLRYEPAKFATTEPFLLYFFMTFIAIAVLFAHRAAPRLTHYVDGTLVFGTPVVAMALQMELVRDIVDGRAFSALGAGTVYLLIAAWLHGSQRDTLRLLKESFLAIGVAFLTLAVPLWLDDTWTAATWALEGAALVWIGLRQQRWLSTCSGILLQFVAAAAYLVQDDAQAAVIPVANAQCMGALILGVAGLFCARFAAQANPMLKAVGQMPSNLLLAWGMGWWLFASGNEVQEFVSVVWRSGALLGLCAVTALAAGALVRPLSWPALRAPALLILPVMIAAALAWSALGLHPGSEAGWLAWPAGFAALWLNLWWHEASLPGRMTAVLHGLALWLLALLISWELHWQLVQITAPGAVWAGAVWGVAPTLLLAVLASGLVERCWPLRNFALDCRRWVACGAAAVLVVWSLWLNIVSDGAAAPLAYFPLLNPLDISVGLALLVIAGWLRAVWRAGEDLVARDLQPWMLGVMTAATFFWLNAVLLRTMHYWGGVPYRLDDMLASTAVQAALSIFWTLLALGAMLWANRVGWRVMWFGGAGLMAVVVAKLFLVDLVRVGTVPRIVSFLVVGLLMLVIGYFSPLPPARKSADA